MLKKFLYQHAIWSVTLLALIAASSCKKSKSEGPSRDELTKDSIYLYAQQTYYWNSGMPSYADFNPRKYSSNTAILTAIKALPSTGGKDKYSFIDDGTVASELGGVAGDFGFSVFFNDANDLRIKYVYASSPAAVQGLKRGYRITKINGSTAISTSDTNISYIVNAVFGTASSISLTVTKPDGTSQDVTLSKASYNINPVLYSHTYTVGPKKVGYIVFNSFTTNSATLLDAAFAQFANDGITELVVDLRYNGGGSVATSEAFTNLIAPASQNGKVMYTTYWTQTMQNKAATILQNQKFYAKGTDGVTRLYSYFDYDYQPTAAAGNQEVFAKRGTLNTLNRVYFLVLNGTASASELLINNLKPVMDVKLIGKTTYGKPVGFFALHIDKNDLYIPQFETKNQRNEGGYFSGMMVDKDIADDVTRDFGDPAERLLAQALNYSANGVFTSYVKDNTISSTSGLSRAVSDNAAEKLDHEFKGMVETRKLKLNK